MAAFIDQNEVVAQKRRCDLLIYSIVDNSFAPPGTTFTGYVFISQASSDYIAAVGTLTNKRRPLVFADLEIESTDQSGNTVQITGHGLKTGDGLVTGPVLEGSVTYYVIRIDDDNIAFAATLADAYAGTKLDIISDITGETIADNANTKRGIPGQFLYEWTQAETNFDGSEGAVMVAEESGFYAYATVTFKKLPKGFDDEAEAGITYGDYMRACGRGETQLFDEDDDGNYVHYKPDGTTPSHGGQVTSAGRISVTTPDFTP